MSVNLYLVRHGEAESAAASDSERSLTEVGSQQNRQVAEQFAARQAAIDLALVSPLRRARETAADLEAVLGDLNFQESRLIIPDAEPVQLIEFIADQQIESALLVGHNPLLSRLLSLLLEGDLHSGPGLATSDLVAVSMDVMAPACGELNYILHAD